MRNLKRTLSLVLAAAMLIGMMVVGASAANVYDSFTDKDEIVNQEAVSVLTTLNVINGKNDGSYYDPTGIVTRAEMAKMITIILNGGEDPVLGVKDTPTYTDIKGHWAESYIEYCSSSSLKIIAGRGDGRFDPGATVTAAEAAKMMLTALGYDAEVFSLTGASWQINTDVFANQANLYKGLSINSSVQLTRDNAAQMLYNALNAHIMEKSYDKVLSNGQVSYNYALSEFKTLLNDTYGAWKVEGVVVANEYADLGASPAAALREGSTNIIVTNPDELRTGASTRSLSVGTSINSDHLNYGQANTFNISTGAEELGQTITLYVRPAESSTQTTRASIIGAYVSSENNVVATTTSNKNTETAVNNWLRGENLKLDNDSILVTDFASGVAGGGSNDVFGTNTATAAGLVGKGNGATVTAIDCNADGNVEFVFVTNYVFTKVASINTSNNKMTLTGFAAKEMDDIVAYDGIAKDDYVLMNQAGGKMYIAKPETIEGEITAYTYNGTSEDSITIDGQKLNVSAIPVNASESAWNVVSTGVHGGLSSIVWNSTLIGKETTMYLDANGYATVMGSSSALTAENICLVVRKSAANVMGTGVQVYVVFADGTKGTYSVTSVNGSTQGMMDAITEMRIASYTLSDNGIALTTDANLNVASQTGNKVTGDGESLAISDKGQSRLTINSTTAYAGNETVYFLVDSTAPVDITDKDYITVVKGMDAVGANIYTAASPLKLDDEANAAGAQIVYNISGGRNHAVGVLGVKAGASLAAYSNELIYMADTKYEMHGNTKEINVIMPGETTVTKLTVDRNQAQAVGLYEFSVSADSVYDLNVVSYGNNLAGGDPTYAGYINCVNDQVVYLNTVQASLTDKTLIIDATDSANPVTINAADLRGLNPYGYVYYDSNNNITAIYVTGFFATLTSFGGQTVTVTNGMGTKGNPLVASVTGVTGFVFGEPTDTNKLTAGYAVITNANNADVQVFNNAAYTSAVTSITTGDYFVSVAADNATTVYYKITVSAGAPVPVTIDANDSTTYPNAAAVETAVKDAFTGGADAVSITNGGLTLSAAYTVPAGKTLTVANSITTGSFDLTVAGTVEVTAGGINATGQSVIVADGGALEVTAGGITATTVEVTGDLTVTAGGVTSAVDVKAGGTADITGGVTTVTDVAATGTLTVTGDVDTVTDNNGTLTITGDVTTKITDNSGDLTVTGTVAQVDNITAGTVTFDGAVTTVTAISGGTVNFGSTAEVVAIDNTPEIGVGAGSVVTFQPTAAATLDAVEFTIDATGELVLDVTTEDIDIGDATFAGVDGAKITVANTGTKHVTVGANQLYNNAGTAETDDSQLADATYTYATDKFKKP